jgi:hypothetical protein
MQALLESLDREADGGLADTQRTRGSGEAAGVDHREQREQRSGIEIAKLWVVADRSTLA